MIIDVKYKYLTNKNMKNIINFIVCFTFYAHYSIIGSKFKLVRIKMNKDKKNGMSTIISLEEYKTRRTFFN